MDSVFPLNKLESTRTGKKDIKIVDTFVNSKRNVKSTQLFIYDIYTTVYLFRMIFYGYDPGFYKETKL